MTPKPHPSMCDKSHKCKHGLNCGRDFYPSVGFLCFDRGKPKPIKRKAGRK